MAKIEYTHPETEHSPAFTETIEVRVWSMAGEEWMPFTIGRGVNFHANGTVLLEIIYSVEGVQIFYTRNFVQHDIHCHLDDAPGPEKRLEAVLKKGKGKVGFGECLPETGVWLILEKHKYKDEEGGKVESTWCTLKISADTGTVFGRSFPGQRFVEIRLDMIDQEKGVRFMRDLNCEMDAVQSGKHPDPATFPDGSSEWPFALQLNRLAYKKISEDYLENYSSNAQLTEAFEGWLAQLPPGGQVLDAGCGHGQPVIARLLEKGFQVTGSDISPEMLRRAAEQFPQASFVEKAITMIRDQASFDGICSFNALLYFDTIDFLNSIYRLHNALKPGGLLFLYGYNSGPDWRGDPFDHRLKQWMWSWHYSMEEAIHLLEEHGYFKVLETREEAIDEAEEQRLAQAHDKQKQEEEEYYRRQAASPNTLLLPFLPIPIERSPYTYMIIAQRCEREGIPEAKNEHTPF